MKVILALTLLLFLDPVFSQKDVIYCSTFGRCPKGYSKHYSGSTILNVACLCKKDSPISPCNQALENCVQNSTPTCSKLEAYCSPKEIIDLCIEYGSPIPDLCDRANQKLIKEKNESVLRHCEFYKTQCNRGIANQCINAASFCDSNTILQLCKNKRISSNFICENAEIQNAKDEAEKTKYSCASAQTNCQQFTLGIGCSEVPKFCGVETAAKWCYKDEATKAKRLREEDCSRVIKKSQYLTFGQTSGNCWRQLPLCEGGDFEACIQVPTLCGKEVVSALCSAKKITNRRMCTYAGLEETTSSRYPGCKFFADKCNHLDPRYCELASRYCDDKTIGALCSLDLIEDASICEKMLNDDSIFYSTIVTESVTILI